MMHIPYDHVTDTQRRIGKVLNFGILYGQQAPGVAHSLGIRITEARELMDAYEAKIVEIMAFKRSAIETAREQGYVETYYGRRRLLPDLRSPNRSQRLKAERQVVNTMVQGTGADIAKIVMLKLHRANWQIDAMLHDGFLTSVPKGTVDASIAHLRNLMEMDLEGVRLTVTYKVGESWGDCK
jgi:DNA polymerase-1